MPRLLALARSDRYSCIISEGTADPLRLAACNKINSFCKTQLRRAGCLRCDKLYSPIFKALTWPTFMFWTLTALLFSFRKAGLLRMSAGWLSGVDQPTYVDINRISTLATGRFLLGLYYYRPRLLNILPLLRYSANRLRLLHCPNISHSLCSSE